MSKKAFVTGGTGFIGINLIKLLLEKNWDVVALHRPPSDLTYLGELPVQLKSGSVTDPESLHNALSDDIDVVFHLAGDTGLWSANNQTQTEVNVAGTRNMLRAASDLQIKHFIHTSSASVWSDMDNRQVHEDLPKKGTDSWVNYEKSKCLAENLVLKHGDQNMKTVVLNPTAVLGPYDLNNWGKLFIGLKNGDLPCIPEGVLSVTHVRDVAEAHINAVEKGKHANNYILSGKDCRFKTIIEEVADILNLKKVPPQLPDIVLKSAAHTQCVISRFTKVQPKLTPELVKIMTRKNLTYSNNKAKQTLNYKVTPLKKTLLDSCRWLSSEGHL